MAYKFGMSLLIIIYITLFESYEVRYIVKIQGCNVSETNGWMDGNWQILLLKHDQIPHMVNGMCTIAIGSLCEYFCKKQGNEDSEGNVDVVAIIIGVGVPYSSSLSFRPTA